MPADDGRASARDLVLVTCEHGGHEVPAAWRYRFRGQAARLRSHRGWDPGALPVALRLAARLAAPLVHATTTRLLVDLNRSPGHRSVFGPPVRGLPAEDRARILAEHHAPYRARVERLLEDAVAGGARTLHLSVHTCVDVLDGRARDLDVALLFDPARPREAFLARAWRARLREERPEVRYAFNRPYRGSADGLTTTLRSRLPEAAYLGIEIELRQGFVARAGDRRRAADLLATTLPGRIDRHAVHLPAATNRTIETGTPNAS